MLLPITLLDVAGLPEIIGILLLPQFSTLSYASLVEPLRVCNQLLGEPRFHWLRLGMESVVQSGDGLAVSVEQNLALPHQLDALVICGSSSFLMAPPMITSWLKSQASTFKWSAGIGSGVWPFVDAGILCCRKASLPVAPSALAEQCKTVKQSADLFSVDQGIWTCRGGSAAQDMVLFMLSRLESVELSEMVAQTLLRYRIGEPTTGVRKHVDAGLRKDAPVLYEAVQLMEANIEEPLTTDDIANHLDISRRQLERLFKKYLDSVPSKYYARIRLELARQLLLSSNNSITEIALRCGFSSGAHFSTAYRSLHGITPSEERSSVLMSLHP